MVQDLNRRISFQEKVEFLKSGGDTSFFTHPVLSTLISDILALALKTNLAKCEVNLDICFLKRNLDMS